MVQLYINGQQVDIDKSVGLYITRQFESVQNPTLYFSDYSKTITLPMTANNRRILQQYQRQDSLVTTDGIDPRKKIPYQLLYNSELVMEGYLKINNANSCFSDKKFEVNLYGKFNAIINDISQYTFNKYECVGWGGTKPDEYLIESPWQNIEVTASLVKQSFEQESHDVDGDDILDYLKFVPSYQGKYKDFESDLMQWHPWGLEEELTQERDEHYMREFRSYYQEPALWVCKLWKMMKDKVESTTDYTIDLDSSWFNSENPYWTDMLYTCPSLFTEDENFNPNTTMFAPDSLNLCWNIPQQGALSNAHKRTLLFTPIANTAMYQSGVMNPDSNGYTKFKMSSSIMICCHKIYDSTVTYAKLRRANPLIVKVEAVKRSNGAVLNSRKYMIYSHQTPASGEYNVDEKINVGTTCLTAPNVAGQFPTGYSRYNGYWFEAPIDLELEIPENVPYIVNFTFYFANNGKPCEFSHYQNLAHWDWLWTDWFCTNSNPKGVTIFNFIKTASCSTTNYLRSRSMVDMYRVFPKKDTTLLSVLLNYSKMFGLMWDVDIDNKKISIMTRNKFFTNYRVLDWSKKIDRSKDFKLDPLCFDKRYVSFNVEDGKGMRYESYANKFGVGYGSKKIDTEYQFNTDTEDLFKGIQPALISQKAQFSRMYNTENPDDTENQFMGYNYKIYPNERYIENDNEGENAGNSGAFYFFNGTYYPDYELGFRTTTGNGKILITDDTEHMLHVGKYMWNLSFQDTEICEKLPYISTIDRTGKYSVHFESPAEYYFDVDCSQTRYVFDLFWKRYIDERYSVQNKKLTCYVYLTPNEFKEIRFHDFVKIENTLYHINKVTDYDFDTNSPTKVELCQVWDITAYTRGQELWPALCPIPSSIEVYKSDFVQAAVYSSDPDWYVYSKPNWLICNKDDDRLNMRASSDPLLPRNGVVTLKTTTSPILTASLQVYQRPENTFLVLDTTTKTVESDGICFCVGISSQPTTVEVTNCPSWCDVRFIPHWFAPFGGSVSNVKITIKTASVTVATNYSHHTRTGTITFSNGNIEKSLTITQLGRSFIWEQWDDQPMLVELNHEGIFESYINKQIDPDTAGISSLGTLTKPDKNIDNLRILFSPLLDTVDHGDGTPETCSGGQVTVKTLNGQWITKNYNYGPVVPQYEIWIEQKDFGHFTVDGRLYKELDFKEMTDEGTSYDIVAIPDEGCTFVRWSDGVNTTSRTVIVDSDIHIWPVFTGGYGIEYDNNEIVEFDNYEDVLWDNQ